MKRKTYITLTLISVLTCMLLIPFGGYGGHIVKYVLASAVYFLLTLYCLNKTTAAKEVASILLILALPPALLYLPFHIVDFHETKLGFISTLGHFAGVGFGFAVHAMNKRKLVVTVLFLSLTLWVTFVGYPYWLKKVYAAPVTRVTR